jgi:hypothetical protein
MSRKGKKDPRAPASASVSFGRPRTLLYNVEDAVKLVITLFPAAAVKLIS